MIKVNKAMVESYARNLLGQVIAAATIVSGVTHVSFANFGSHEWGLVANTLWASLVPVAIRYANKKDPAFGIVAQAATDAVTEKIAKATKTSKKA